MVILNLKNETNIGMSLNKTAHKALRHALGSTLKKSSNRTCRSQVNKKNTTDLHRSSKKCPVGGASRHKMSIEDEYNELSWQFESELMLDQRTLELIALIEGTDDPDIRQVAISDIFKEKGIRY
jgi:hypothetical protein